MKALALFSGGLDSQLAIKIISKTGIEVEALFFDTGFGARSDLSDIMRKRALEAGASSFSVIDSKDAYLRVLLTPKYGYGKHFNPCIDCHAFMFECALDMLKEKNASFVISGEVLGQRPMSQRSDALKKVKGLARDDDDLILRPLCAKLLAPCKPILQGWVKEEDLLDISGRSRTRQLKLADEFGFKDFASPGGGCLLTLDNFSAKIKDLLKHKSKPSVSDLQLLKWGRHLRLEHGSKLIIGRNEEENAKLNAIKDENYLDFDLCGLSGAYSLIDKNYDERDQDIALGLVLAYTKAPFDTFSKIVLNSKEIKAKPLPKEAAQEFLV